MGKRVGLGWVLGIKNSLDTLSRFMLFKFFIESSIAMLLLQYELLCDILTFKIY